MAKLALIGVIGVVVAGGGVAAWYLNQGGPSGLDAAGQELLTRYAAEQGRETADAEAQRELLKDLKRHPEAESHPGLLRAQAWANIELGNSLRAWEAIQGNLGVDVETIDLKLGARILQARHSETGDQEQADQALACARNHFEATGDVSSLFLAWQMATRMRDTDRGAELRKQLLEHPESIYGRTVAALGKFPAEVDQSDGTRGKLLGLLDEFEQEPEELALALAWWEISKGEHRLRGLQRCESVLRTFRVSRLARTLIATAAFFLKDYRKAGQHVDYLLKAHPADPRATGWREMKVSIDRALSEGK